MAKTIPQLTDATTVNAADELIISQSGITKRATGAELAKGLNTINGTVNVKDFGAVGDGVADDTAAIQSAINLAAGRTVFLPAGIYMVTSLFYRPSSNIPIVIAGAGTSGTIIRKMGTSSAPVLDIGNSPSPAFITQVKVADLTIDGTNKTGRASLRTMDCWYVTLNNLRLINSQVGLEMLTAIFVDAQTVTTSNNNEGVSISYYPGGSFPNSQPGVVTFSNCVSTDNSAWGLKFDDGTTLVLRNCAIENSGTTIGASDQGGIWVGPNVGRFNVGTTTPGVSLYDCHFEGNKGIAGVHILSGRSILQNVFFWESPSGTTNDIRIEGGFYSIYNVTCASTKSPNLLETVGVGIGNIISQSKIDSITINEAKTTVSNAPSLKLPFLTIGGSQGPTAALTFQNASTYWDVKQLGGTSFGVYNGTLLAAYWDANRHFSPGQDNANTLGKAADRWAQVFAGTGTINTSDGREKQQVSQLSPAEKATGAAIRALIKRYKFNDAVEKKGESARWHFGVLAQDVKAAFESNGLDVENYGLFCYDEWDEQQEVLNAEGQVEVPYRAAGSRYGIRYGELLSFLHACET